MEIGKENRQDEEDESEEDEEEESESCDVPSVSSLAHFSHMYLSILEDTGHSLVFSSQSPCAKGAGKEREHPSSDSEHHPHPSPWQFLPLVQQRNPSVCLTLATSFHVLPTFILRAKLRETFALEISGSCVLRIYLNCPSIESL